MIPTQRAAMELALDALELNCASQTESPATKAMQALRAALAEQSQQEPVARVVDMNGTESLEWHSDVQADLIFGTAVQPLYTAPQPAKREPLTQQEVVDGYCKTPHQVQYVAMFDAGVRFAERAHGITGGAK